VSVIDETFKQLVAVVSKNARLGQRASALLVLGLLFLTATGVLAAAKVDVAAGGVKLTAVLGGLSVVAFLGGLVMAMFPERLSVIAVEVRARGGEVLLGIDVGDDWVKYGVVRVTTQDLKFLPPDRYLTVVGDERELRFEVDANERFAHVVEAIVDAAKTHGRFYGIGLGLPGQIDPMLKRIVNPSGPFKFQENFVETLAQRVASADGAVVFRALGLPENSGAAALADKILIDHHVRCSTRSVLSKHRGDHGWHHFVLLNVDWGVGSGLVLEDRVYYGSSFTAGEVGHMTLHLDDEIVEPSAAAARRIDPCQCQLVGAHWEAFVSAGGLLGLARAVDERAFAQVVAGFDGEAAEDVTPGHVLVACMAAEGRRNDGSAGLPAVTWSGSDEAKEYLRTVMNRYAFYLAIGLGDLLNVLDLDHVLMGGYVMRALWPLPAVRLPFSECLREHVLSEAFRSVQFVDASDASAWLGAALLFRDPSYELMLEARAGGHA
jgi:predicted NBD/HSP70 family sugar kinase